MAIRNPNTKPMYHILHERWTKGPEYVTQNVDPTDATIASWIPRQQLHFHEFDIKTDVYVNYASAAATSALTNAIWWCWRTNSGATSEMMTVFMTGSCEVYFEDVADE